MHNISCLSSVDTVYMCEISSVLDVVIVTGSLDVAARSGESADALQVNFYPPAASCPMPSAFFVL